MKCIFCGSKFCSSLEDDKVCTICERAIKQLCLNMRPDRIKELTEADKAGRLVVPDFIQTPWLKAILDERERQDKKWGFPQENTYGEWGSILAEEVGKLAKELNELNFGRGNPDRMRKEAVQVAAVALALLEQSEVAYLVTVQAADALGRLTCQEAEAAAERKEENT